MGLVEIFRMDPLVVRVLEEVSEVLCGWETR